MRARYAEAFTSRRRQERQTDGHHHIDDEHANGFVMRRYGSGKFCFYGLDRSAPLFTTAARIVSALLHPEPREPSSGPKVTGRS